VRFLCTPGQLLHERGVLHAGADVAVTEEDNGAAPRQRRRVAVAVRANLGSARGRRGCGRRLLRREKIGETLYARKEECVVCAATRARPDPRTARCLRRRMRTPRSRAGHQGGCARPVGWVPSLACGCSARAAAAPSLMPPRRADLLCVQAGRRAGVLRGAARVYWCTTAWPPAAVLGLRLAKS
jgi:hypothetical protein